MSLPQDGSRDDGENLTLGIALNTGISLGAHFVEVYEQSLDIAGIELLGDHRSNGLDGGAVCAIAAALRQTSTIKRGNVDL